MIIFDYDYGLQTVTYLKRVLLYIRLTMKNLIGREHSIDSQ